MSATVSATDAAHEVILRLKAHYGSLIFVQSGGCCDGSSPICLKDGELPITPQDIRLGTIGGVPVYIDAEQYERWGSPQFQIDVSPGEADNLSLEGLGGVHFVTRTLDRRGRVEDG